MSVHRPIDPIEVRFIGEPEAKRHLRRRVLNAGAAAVSRANRSGSALAHAILSRTAQIAADWQFASASATQLQDVLVGITGLFVAANAFERADAGDA